MNKFKITETNIATFGDFTKSKLEITKKNKSRISDKDIFKLNELMFQKALTTGSKFIIRGETDDGKIMTLKGYDDNDLNYWDEENYLVGRKRTDTNFIKYFRNLRVVINKFN